MVLLCFINVTIISIFKLLKRKTWEWTLIKKGRWGIHKTDIEGDMDRKWLILINKLSLLWLVKKIKYHLTSNTVMNQTDDGMCVCDKPIFTCLLTYPQKWVPIWDPNPSHKVMHYKPILNGCKKNNVRQVECVNSYRYFFFFF